MGYRFLTVGKVDYSIKDQPVRERVTTSETIIEQERNDIQNTILSLTIESLNDHSTKTECKLLLTPTVS